MSMGVNLRPFEVEVGGTPNPDVLWLKDGIVITNKPGHIKLHSNGPCHTLIIANVKVMFAFKYSNWNLNRMLQHKVIYLINLPPSLFIG